LASTSTGLRAPGSTVATTGWPSGNCSAAAWSGTLNRAQTALTARTRYWLARALAARGDAARARTKAAAARDAARGFGMARLAERAEELLESITAR